MGEVASVSKRMLRLQPGHAYNRAYLRIIASARPGRATDHAAEITGPKRAILVRYHVCLEAPKQVAAKCGFANADNTLRRAFVKHVGVTPAEYRRGFDPHA